MTHRSLLGTLIGTALLSWLAAPADAATPDEAAAGLAGGLYVEAGAEQVDAPAIRATASDAAGDLTLAVVVLAGEEESAVPFAEAVKIRTRGTVLVFTPAAYGAASDELSQAELDAALLEAAAELAGPDIAAGVAAFVAAAAPGTVPWGLIFGIGIPAIVLIAIGGRMVERRATRGRRAEALAKRWAALQARADALADPILELSTRVGLHGGEEASTAYREASSLFSDVRTRLDRSARSSQASRLDADLGRLEALLERVRRLVGA
jgi:hypothetical protein